MSKMLFREKSIERVTSPEQLNDCIRVTSPSVWMLLAGIFFVLSGICIWGIFGRMDTVVTVGAMTNDNQTVCYVKADDLELVNTGMTVRMKDEEYRIESISLQPIRVDSDFPEYLCHIGDLSRGEWVYEVKLDTAVGESGSIVYADIVIESIAPMSFVIN